MQKKLIALALASLAGSAFAQSNVTIYGVADGTFDVVKSTGSTAPSTTNTDRFNRISTNSSLIGFKGTEDLGNGLKAVFQYESAVGFDNLGTLGATRDSFVGASGGFGSVVAGNLTGPTRALGAAVDVNAGATGIGANAGIIGKLRGGNGSTSVVGACGRSTTCTSTVDTRFANSIAYVSPSFAGFQGTVVYVASENRTNQSAAAATVANGKGFDVGVNYKNGPIMAGVTYAALKSDNAFTTDSNNLRVAGAFDFGMGSVRALWEKTRANDLTFRGDNFRGQKWGLGGTFKLGNGNLLAQYYRANDVSGVSDSGAKLYEVGYEHSLSKRTIVKAVYAQINNDNNANFDFGINAVGTTPAVGGSSAVGNGSNVSGIQVGLRHSF